MRVCTCFAADDCLLASDQLPGQLIGWLRHLVQEGGEAGFRPAGAVRDGGDVCDLGHLLRGVVLSCARLQHPLLLPSASWLQRSLPDTVAGWCRHVVVFRMSLFALDSIGYRPRYWASFSW